MILFQLFTGGKPFADVKLFDLPDVVLSGEKPPLPDYLDSSISKLISECLETDPSKRPDYQKIENILLNYLKHIQPGSSRNK